MSALATEDRPRLKFSAAQLFEPSGSTLEDVILGAWEDLALKHEAECPVCGSRLDPLGCSSCGSQLS